MEIRDYVSSQKILFWIGVRIKNVDGHISQNLCFASRESTTQQTPIYIFVMANEAENQVIWTHISKYLCHIWNFNEFKVFIKGITFGIVMIDL